MNGLEVTGDLLSGGGATNLLSEDVKPVEIGQICSFLNRYTPRLLLFIHPARPSLPQAALSILVCNIDDAALIWQDS